MEPKYIYFLLSYSKTDIRQLVSVTLFSRSLVNTKKNFPVERLTEKKGGGIIINPLYTQYNVLVLLMLLKKTI